MKETVITDVQNIELCLCGVITLLTSTILGRRLECHLRADETRGQLLKAHLNNGMLFPFQSLFLSLCLSFFFSPVGLWMHYL